MPPLAPVPHVVVSIDEAGAEIAHHGIGHCAEVSASTLIGTTDQLADTLVAQVSNSDAGIIAVIGDEDMRDELAEELNQRTGKIERSIEVRVIPDPGRIEAAMTAASPLLRTPRAGAMAQ